MEHLEYLAQQVDTETYPIITRDEFIKYVKEHKEELKPVINNKIHVTKPDGTSLDFLCLLCVTICFVGDDLAYFLLDEFHDVINANICQSSHLTMIYPDGKIRRIAHPRLHLILAKHPSFEVNFVFAVWDEYRFINNEDPMLLEKIIAIANPNNYKPQFNPLDNTCELEQEYYKDPVGMHKKFKAKHFDPRKASQVFCFTLLIANKFLLV